MEEKEKTTMAKYTRSSSMAATITPIFIVVDAWSLPPRSKEVTEQRLSEITKNICKTEEYICWKLYTKYIHNLKSRLWLHCLGFVCLSSLLFKFWSGFLPSQINVGSFKWMKKETKFDQNTLECEKNSKSDHILHQLHVAS